MNMNQQERLINYLERHTSIDPIAAWHQLGIYRLADTVYQLKKQGYNIVTERVEVSNRYGEACRVANYKLERGLESCVS